MKISRLWKNRNNRAKRSFRIESLEDRQLMTIDLSNGLLHIDSVPGKGSRIRVFIPLTSDAIEKVQAGKVDLQDS